MHISSPHEFMAIKAGEQKKKSRHFMVSHFIFPGLVVRHSDICRLKAGAFDRAPC